MVGVPGLPLDPCALVVVSNIDKERHEQKEQTFYCHFECFRKVVADDSYLYIMQEDFSTIGECEDERASEDRNKKRNPGGDER